jgi:hypothetical protein
MRNAHRRILTDAEEQELVSVITVDFIRKDVYCPSSCIMRTAKDIWIRNRPDANDVPVFSYSWLSKSLSKHALSLRKSHVKRRQEPNDEIVSAFISDIDWIFNSLPPGRIFNADETCWRVVDGQLRTVAKRGADAVTCMFPCDQKLSVTVMACIAKDGVKLPLWVVIKGKTRACERKVREDEYISRAISTGQLFITHSESGWVDKIVAIEYVKWMRRGFLWSSRPDMGCICGSS